MDNSYVEEQARGCLRKVSKRYPMIESSIHESAGFWKNDATPIAVFNFAESVEPWKKDQVTSYEAEAACFVNEMNERLHVPGWHIDSDSLREGSVILRKDRKSDHSFSSSEGDYGFMYEGAYLNYLNSKANSQKVLKAIVNEALIISDKAKPLEEATSELLAVSEGAGDFINDAWTKFKNFFAKLWQKFNEFISRNLNTDKNYLAKYKTIIINKEVQLGDCEVDGDYTLGVKNITNFSVYTPNASDINNFPNGPENGGDKLVQQKLMPRYRSAGNVEFADFCKSYFKGGSTKHVFTKANLNMSDLYNFCYNYDKIVQVINKDRVAMENAIRAFQQAAQDIDKGLVANQAPPAQTPVAGQGTGNTPPGSGQGTGNTTKPDGKDKAAPKEPSAAKKAAEQEMNAAETARDAAKKAASADPNNKQLAQAAAEKQAAYDRAKGKFIAIKEGVRISALYKIPMDSIIEALNINDSSGKTASGTAATTANSNNANFGNVSSQGTTLRDKAGDGAQNLDKGKNSEEILKAKLSMYTTTCSTIFSSMLTAAQTINKDYMGIIKAHVQSYLGNTDGANMNAKAMTNNTPNINLSDEAIASIQKQLSDIEAQQDQTQKNTLINNLLNYASGQTGTDPQGNPVRTFKSPEEIKQVVDALEAQKKAAAAANQQTPPAQP